MADRLQELFAIAKRTKNFGTSVGDGGTVAGLHPFDARNIHADVSEVSLALFDDGHFSQATFEAFKLIDKRVEELSGLSQSGKPLMMTAFKEDDAKITLNSLTTISDMNEQEGYKFLFAGSIVGIRNPRGHDVGKSDGLEDCLDHLSLASHLMRVLDERVE